MDSNIEKPSHKIVHVDTHEIVHVNTHEHENLNIEDLDVQELEHRIEFCGEPWNACPAKSI